MGIFYKSFNSTIKKKKIWVDLKKRAQACVQTETHKMGP